MWAWLYSIFLKATLIEMPKSTAISLILNKQHWYKHYFNNRKTQIFYSHFTRPCQATATHTNQSPHLSTTLNILHNTWSFHAISLSHFHWSVLNLGSISFDFCTVQFEECFLDSKCC